MTIEALKAAQTLSAQGIEAEVVDLRTLSPLDMDSVAASVENRARCRDMRGLHHGAVRRDNGAHHGRVLRLQALFVVALRD
jgi:pyruvate/2-oxoglutarate/acetoin dehydrogenase E1 component